MKRVELKVARIGNSRGIRLPAATLARYRIGDSVVMEERSEGILLRPHGRVDVKLSWQETADEMASHAEDWKDWESIVADGLDEIPWERRHRRQVAERSSKYQKARGRKGRRRES
jgi:antitoxin component of MazEF toxin-antitoxin module